jgi:hypothetical protein
MSKLSIYKVKDSAENHYIDKEVIFNVPFRLLVVGRSYFSGKSNMICNLLLRDEFYNSDFSGNNIFIVSPSLDTDEKLQKLVQIKEIPEANLMMSYDEEMLTELYKMLEEEYEYCIDNKIKPEQKVIIFDDMSFSGALKAKEHGIINKMFSNGRHILLSVIVTAQKYTSISTSARENASGVIIFNSSNKQLETVEADHNVLPDGKKPFMKMFRECIQDKHSFFVVNYSNPIESRYLDCNFKPITYNK